ncbi:MAG: hypothetical protein AMJ79_00060 [Phycisphaerae bacterium SM23_30]|nr:MAG: hypothetical protein AMJ79_00060 [Phycisphaerae bacterium SM23_30]
MKKLRQNNPQESDYLRGILNELSLMLSSNDLKERYQCFIRVVESSLEHALGYCGVTLWCPDEECENLIECVIEPSRTKSRFPAGAAPLRVPCRVPLDSQVIRDSLLTGEPYLGLVKGANQVMLGRTPEATLQCDACIPLYRNYGQPLLISVERIEEMGRKCRREDFQASVQLINLFWKQLQSTNQRQWLVEHDQTSGALRDEVFLRQGQTWANTYQRRDEPFTVVVITVRGFRSIFTGNSQQWRRLSKVVGRCLNKVLREKSSKYLLGKMADDVFALMLPSKDNFLTDAVMHTLADRFGQEMVSDKAIETLDILAVDIQWSIADHNSYEGNLEILLNKIYRRLFSRNHEDHKHTHRIILNEQSGTVEIQPCK